MRDAPPPRRDGRSDSQWSQALGPLESAVEHGGDRTQYAHVIAAHYRQSYERVFGPLPSLDGLPQRAGPVADSIRRAAWERIPAVRREDITRVYANIGKAIAAFERRIELVPTRFDRFVAAELANQQHASASASADGVQMRGDMATSNRFARITRDDVWSDGAAPPATPDASRRRGRFRDIENDCDAPQLRPAAPTQAQRRRRLPVSRYLLQTYPRHSTFLRRRE